MRGSKPRYVGQAGERQVARDLRVHRGPDRGLVAQHRADHVRVAARVGLEVVLDLGHVALEARAEREQARHLLGEELRGVRLRPVDAGGAADDDRPHASAPSRARRAAGASRSRSRRASPAATARRPAGARSGCAPPCRPRAAGSASRSPGCGCRPRSARCARARCAARACRAPPRTPPTGSRSRRAASSAPRWLPTPVISTRRPGISRRLGLRLAAAAGARFAGCALAGRRSSIASSRRPIARSSAFSSRMSS